MRTLLLIAYACVFGCGSTPRAARGSSESPAPASPFALQGGSRCNAPHGELFECPAPAVTAGTISSRRTRTASGQTTALAGRVVDPHDARVGLHGVNIVVSFAQRIQTAQSDRNGRFRIDGLSPGPVQLWFLGFGNTAEGATVPISAGDETEIEVRLAQLGEAPPTACPCRQPSINVALVEVPWTGPSN